MLGIGRLLKAWILRWLADGQKWPDALWIVRHSQSNANVARDQAEQAGHGHIGVEMRDADVPLSVLGEKQSAAFGRWVGTLPADQRPTVVLVSPYTRARMTAEGIMSAAWLAQGKAITYVVDERLREIEYGILDGLTKKGIQEKFAAEYRRRQWLGKFYYRPPGGESWCDLILRLRSVLETITREYRGERVMIVCHSVVVECFRYLLERMDEETILKLNREDEVPNCSLTSYRFDPKAGRHGKLVLDREYFVVPT